MRLLYPLVGLARQANAAAGHRPARLLARIARILSEGPARLPRQILPDPIPDRINLGCGYDKRPGYLNVDVDPACRPDLLLDPADDSVIPRGHFREVYARDVLEHIPRPQTLHALLNWASYLQPEGRLVLQTSHILGVARKLGQMPSFADQYGWTICLFGNQAHPGDFHFTGFTETTLRVFLGAAGFSIESLEEREGWLFHVAAVKREDLFAPLQERAGDDAFITRIYRDILGRAPDATGLPHIRALVRGGAHGRLQALRHLATSAERLYLTASRLGL